MRKVLLILGHLSDADVAWLARSGSRIRLQPGTELIREGTRIDAIYVILDGEMSIWTSGVRFANVGIGDIVGELSMLDASPTAASVRVERPSTVLVVPKSLLKTKLEQDVAFAANFYMALAQLLADRMRNVIRRVRDGKAAEPTPEEASPAAGAASGAAAAAVAQERVARIVAMLSGA